MSHLTFNFFCLAALIQGRAASTEAETEELLLKGTGASEQRVSELQAILSPAFASLPKNRIARLEWPAVRQLVHRYFVGQHGWHVKGLEPHHDAKVSVDLLNKGRIVGDSLRKKLIQALQQHLDNGCTLRGTAVLVAVLEQVILDEGIASTPHLKASYRFNGLSTNSSLSKKKLETVIDSAMILFIQGGDMSDTQRHRLVRQNMNQIYPGWKKTQDFTHRVVSDFVHHHGNGSKLSFTGVHAAMDEVGIRYGKFQEVDCQDMKSILMDMDPLRTGRVPLSDFYAKEAHGAWQFSESEEYLRSLGILDESGFGQGPQVIISNYLTSDNNCLAKTPHHTVCCLHECETLVGAVEASVRRPVASPTEILALVSGISSSTVKAPRQASPVLVEALQQIAGLHRGKVPLHGRLFSQWMHYAFPHECPYPHRSDAVASMTPEEWTQSFHRSSRATPWQVQAGVRAGHVLRSQDGVKMLPPLPLAQWSLKEELLAGTADDAAVDHWAYALAEPFSYALAAGLAVFVMFSLASGLAAMWRMRLRKIGEMPLTGDAGRALLETESSRIRDLEL